jgi:hypothetical protein
MAAYAMLEHELLKGVIDVARILGWRVAHFRAAMTKHGWRTAVQADGAGWPDLILVRERLLVRELKCGKNTLSAEQAAWLEALRAAGVDAGVWTEHAWLSGEIEAELRRGTRHERTPEHEAA